MQRSVLNEHVIVSPWSIIKVSYCGLYMFLFLQSAWKRNPSMGLLLILFGRFALAPSPNLTMDEKTLQTPHQSALWDNKTDDFLLSLDWLWGISGETLSNSFQLSEAVGRQARVIFAHGNMYVFSSQWKAAFSDWIRDYNTYAGTCFLSIVVVGRPPSSRLPPVPLRVETAWWEEKSPLNRSNIKSVRESPLSVWQNSRQKKRVYLYWSRGKEPDLILKLWRHCSIRKSAHLTWLWSWLKLTTK